MLLESNETKRLARFEQLGNLYDERSSLVHGKSEPNIEAAYRHRDDALRIALDAMRTTYDVPGLLDENTSDGRYKRMMLGVSGGTKKG